MSHSSTATVPATSAGRLLRLWREMQGGWRKGMTVAAALLVIAVAYHVVFGQNGLTSYQHKRHDYKNLDSELKSLQRENDQLKSHVDRLQSDPNAIEHAAREELHYTRPGEVIYTLPPTPADTSHKAPKN